jgi:mRNA export factor
MSYGFGGGAAAGGAASLAEGLCQTPGNPDSISKISWSKSGQFIAASNWDGNVRLYQQQQNGFSFAAASVVTQNNSPVLCCDWHHDGNSLFTCGGDNMAMRCTLAGGQIQPTPVAKHDAPIKAMTWWSDVNLLVPPPLPQCT